MNKDSGASHLKFEGFSLHLAKGALIREGKVVPLPPKPYEVLRLLAENSQRLLLKNEILDSVWPGMVVGDDSLTQCITQIRKAIGDDSKTILKTVPRRGFILDAPRVDLPSTKQPSPKTQSRVPALVLSTALVLIVGALFWLKYTDAPSDLPVFISVQEFDSNSKGLAVGARLMAESLRLRLDEIPGLAVRSMEVGNIDDSGLIEQADEKNIDWLLTGSIKTVSGAKTDKITLSLWDVDRGSHHSLGVFSVPVGADTGSTREFIVQRDLVIERALSRLPAHLVDRKQKHGFPKRLSDFETYAETMAALENEQCNPTLAENMQPVVKRTPDFMRGWMAIAWAHWVDSWACGLDSLPKAIMAADRVLELEPNYPQGIKVKTSALAAQGDVRAAQSVAWAAVNESPERAANWATLSYLLNYSGDIEESVRAIEKALAFDPLVLIAETGETPNVYLYANEWEKYLQYQPPFDAPFFNFQRAYALYRLGRFNEAELIVNKTINETPVDLYSSFSAALRDIIQGRPKDAAQTILFISRQRRESGASDGEATFRQATMLRLAGADEAAIQNLWDAYHQNFVCPQCVRRDPIWQDLLSDERLVRWLGTAERASVSDSQI